MNDSHVTNIHGRALPLRGADIDTDRIIPARFLRTVTFDELGGHAFEDDRAGGGHPFDDPRYQGASILITNANFGCGSSREHAPQALMRSGIRAFIGESYAEIFFGNCVANGLPCVVLPPSDVARLQDMVEADPALIVSLNLTQLTVTCGSLTLPIGIPEGAREQLVTGRWDSLGQLLEAGAQIEAAAARLPYIDGAFG